MTRYVVQINYMKDGVLESEDRNYRLDEWGALQRDARSFLAFGKSRQITIWKE